MHFVRKALVFIATAFLTLWLFTIAITASIVLTFHNPSKIKHWISHSGIYNKVVDAVVQQSQKTAKAGDIPLTDPHVKQAAKQAFSPALLQHDTDSVIDGMYGWLQGKTKQPEFSIDLATPKKQFATNIGNYLRNRTKHLPACGSTELVSNDLFTLNCIPSGYNVNAEIQRNVNKLANNKEFLGDPAITASDLKGEDKQSVFANDKLSQIPRAYQQARWSPLLLGVLAVAAVAIVVFAHDNRRRGVKRVAWVFLPVGLVILLGSLGIHQATAQLDSQIKLNDAGKVLQPALVSIIKSITGSLANGYLWFGLAYTAIGAALFLALKFWLKSAPEAASQPIAKADKEPEKSEPSKSA